MPKIVYKDKKLIHQYQLGIININNPKMPNTKRQQVNKSTAQVQDSPKQSEDQNSLITSINLTFQPVYLAAL
jgi:hypothetical protein